MAKTEYIWPEGISAYKRTAEFTHESVPQALLRAHSTKAGVWAKLHILSGEVVFYDLADKSEQVLNPGIHAVIFPQAEHKVAPSENARFFVEFYSQR